MKKSAALLILLAGLMVFAFVYQKSRDKQMNSGRLQGVPTREYLLPDLPVANIRKIRVREDKETVNLAVKGDRWVVEERAGFPAAFEKINRLVTELSELKITGKNVVGPTALKEIRLLPPSDSAEHGSTGVQIDLMNEKGEMLGTLVAGGITNTSGGANSNEWMGAVEQRYVHIPKDENTVWMVKDTLLEWNADARLWLNKAFINVEGIHTITVKSKDPASSWVLERNDPAEGFVLQGAPQDVSLEESLAGQASALLSAPVFTDVHAKDEAAELLKNALEVTLVTFDGFTYDVKVAKKAPEGDSQQGQEGAVYLSFVVRAEVPKERPVAADEKPEDKKAKDDAFAAAVKATEEKLKHEKAFEGWVFELPASAAEVLFKAKLDLLAPKGAEGAPAGGGGLPPGMPNFSLPGLPSSGGAPRGR